MTPRSGAGFRAAVWTLAATTVACQREDEVRRRSSTTTAEGLALTIVGGRPPVALPSPCALGDSVWRGTVRERTRIEAAPSVPGELFVRSGPPAARQAAMLRMELPSTPVTAWSLPGEESAALAVAAPWMVFGTSPGDAALWVARTPQGRPEELSRGEGARLVAARCEDGACAALATLERGSSGTRSHVAFLGQAGEPAGQWRRVELASLDSPRRFGSVDSVGPDRATVAFDLEGRVEWRSVGASEPTVVGALETGAPILASRLDGPAEPLVVTAGSLRKDGEREGGVRILRRGAPPLVLRAATEPTRATLVRAGRALLALWLAPRPSGGTQSLLHAGLVVDGRAFSPVTMVAEVDDYAVAVRDGQVDLWALDDDALVYSRFRCDVSPTDAPGEEGR